MSTVEPAALPCAFVIPAYEPDAGLLALVRAVADARPLAVVVVDDGSPASCTLHFSALEGLDRVQLLRHGANRGKGEAIKTGLRHVLEEVPGAVGAVTMDADGQHTPEDVRRVAERLVRERDALVLGERSFGGGVPLRSRIGNVLTRALVNAATGLDLRDTQTGLRGIPRALIEPLLAVQSSRYEFETDMLFVCRRLGVRVVGVEVSTVYIDRNRSSHFRPVRDSARVWGRLIRHLLRPRR